MFFSNIGTAVFHNQNKNLSFVIKGHAKFKIKFPVITSMSTFTLIYHGILIINVTKRDRMTTGCDKKPFVTLTRLKNINIFASLYLLLKGFQYYTTSLIKP